MYLLIQKNLHFTKVILLPPLLPLPLLLPLFLLILPLLLLLLLTIPLPLPLPLLLLLLLLLLRLLRDKKLIKVAQNVMTCGHITIRVRIKMMVTTPRPAIIVVKRGQGANLQN